MSTVPHPAARGIELQVHLPVTFIERGACVPFTSPPLVGARVRRGDRDTLELIIPNPSGLRGVYVVPWSAMAELCRPTAHDVKLAETIAGLTGISPRAVRQAAHQIGLEGWAGRDVAASVARARAADEQARLATNFHLLLRLVAQIEHRTGPLGDLPKTRTAEMETRIKTALALVGSRLQRPTDGLASDLEDSSALLATCGIDDGAAKTGMGPQAAPARMPQTVASLVEIRNELIGWREDDDEGSYLIARMIVAAVDLTVVCANGTIRAARAPFSDIVQFLVRWHGAQTSVADVITRPEWLLDGWAPIVTLWREAEGPAQRRAALAEIAPLVPVIPKEAANWAALDVDVEHPEQLRRFIPINQDWRSGVAVSDVVARNERRRATA